MDKSVLESILIVLGCNTSACDLFADLQWKDNNGCPQSQDTNHPLVDVVRCFANGTLQLLWLHDAELDGQIPSTIVNLSNLQRLDLSKGYLLLLLFM
jgi:hypothetical protein